MNDDYPPALRTPTALLPIASHRQSLLHTIEKFQVTIVVGQTGSGKTTQLPQFLQQAGWCNDGLVIGVTQPRRVAATSVASRVAEEMRCQVGEEVGYSIRFEDLSSARTKIKFLTDGMLLREALVDPLLSRYSVIMVDEAHERSLSSDILLGLLKKIKKRRPELRIIVSSATLDAKRMADFFTTPDEATISPCKIISLDGRVYPIDILYLEQPTEDYVTKAVETAFDLHTHEPAGDILVFLSGREEIDTALQKLSELSATLHPKAQALQPLPLFAGLSTDEQMYVFSPAAENTRKVVLATNIAEASVTIDGIVYVIDSGFVKLRAYNPTTNIESLTAVPVSKASATQRAGRAGRTKPGKCFRLYTQATYASLPDKTVPEIQRSNLAPVILQLKAVGIDNIVRFDFLSPPPAELVTRAFELLFSLGAVDDYAKLTNPLGTRMAELGSIEPMLAKSLLAASKPEFNCLSEMLSIGAMVSLQGAVFIQHAGQEGAMKTSRRRFAAEEGDLLTLLNVYLAHSRSKDPVKFCRDNHLNSKSLQRAVSIRKQLQRYLERFGYPADTMAISKPSDRFNESSMSGAGNGRQDPTASSRTSSTNICRCLASGYFAHAARMQPDGSFKTVSGGPKGPTLHAHPSSLLFNRKADYVIFSEILETGSAGKTYLRDITKIEKGWLTEFAPEYYKVNR